MGRLPHYPPSHPSRPALAGLFLSRFPAHHQRPSRQAIADYLPTLVMNDALSRHGLSRPSTSCSLQQRRKTWMPGMTSQTLSALIKRLPPRIDRYRLAISRPHDAPVAIGLAADHDDVDLALGKMVDQLIVLGLEPGRHRLLAEGRPGIDVVLHKLQIPVAAGRHLRGLVHPTNELGLGIERTAIDELLRCDRIKQQARR